MCSCASRFACTPQAVVAEKVARSSYYSKVRLHTGLAIGSVAMQGQPGLEPLDLASSTYGFLSFAAGLNVGVLRLEKFKNGLKEFL